MLQVYLDIFYNLNKAQQNLCSVVDFNCAKCFGKIRHITIEMRKICQISWKLGAQTDIVAEIIPPNKLLQQ